MYAFIKRYTGVAGGILLSFGFCYSRVLASIAVALIFIQPFLELPFNTLLKKIKHCKLWWLFGGYFLLVCVSILYSEDIPKYFTQLKLLVPMVLIPTGLLAPSFYKPGAQKVILSAMVVAVFSTGMASFVHYLMNFETINEQIIHSKAVPIVTGINHIYFSILLAFSIPAASHLALQYRKKHRGLFYTMIIMAGFNLLFLHVIAARTGLVGFYASMFIVIGVYIIKSGRYLTGVSGMLGLVLLGIWAVNTVPSLKNRYHNTVKDIQIHLNDKNPNYRSISTRLEAWQVTWQVFKASPVIGVGPADLGTNIQQQYKIKGTMLIPENRMGPHNQYLENLAALGIPGLLILAGLLIYPLRFYWIAGDWMGLALFGLLAFAMLVESILERQVGIGFFTFFWFFWYMRGNINAQISNPE